MWGNTYKSYTDPILRLQKRVLCIITGSAKFSHTAVLFSELHILKLEQIYYCAVQMFMYRYHNNLLPNIFCDFIKPNTELHSYNTRQHSHYHVPVCRLAHMAKNIRYVGVKCHAVFGRLCLSYCSSPHSNKKAVKGMLLTKENWNFNLWFVVCLSRYAVDVVPGLLAYVIVYCGHDAFCVSICESHSLIVRNDYANFSCTCLLFAPLFVPITWSWIWVWIDCTTRGQSIMHALTPTANCKLYE